MSAACLQLTDATLAFPSIHGGVTEEITLRGPGTGPWMNDPDAYHKILAAATEAGLIWEEGPLRADVLANIGEMEEWEEHGTAYEQWCHGEANMDDLHEPSFFTEWSQADCAAIWVGGGCVGFADPEKIPKFTPEMLLQRNTLNYFFNFVWNKSQFPGCPWRCPEVPVQIELLTLTAVGSNHGVAKSMFGAVFVPRGALQHLQHNGGATVGTIFDGEITFTPQNKFPWRLTRDGIKFTYEDMCGTRIDDY